VFAALALRLVEARLLVLLALRLLVQQLESRLA
jgi:hypothetical protein